VNTLKTKKNTIAHKSYSEEYEGYVKFYQQTIRKKK
jgi:hypothetical protein